MAEKLPRCAHNYRTWILGYMMFAKYFLLPTFVIFVIFFGIFCGTQIVAFVNGYTPYPKWCWIFNVLVGMVLVLVITAFGHSAFMNAVRAGYMSLGNIWMFAGLLITMKTAEECVE